MNAVITVSIVQTHQDVKKNPNASLLTMMTPDGEIMIIGGDKNDNVRLLHSPGLYGINRKRLDSVRNGIRL